MKNRIIIIIIMIFSFSLFSGAYRRLAFGKYIFVLRTFATAPARGSPLFPLSLRMPYGVAR